MVGCHTGLQYALHNLYAMELSVLDLQKMDGPYVGIVGSDVGIYETYSYDGSFYDLFSEGLYQIR